MAGPIEPHMGTTTTINERSRVSLSLGAAWSLVGGLVSVVLAIGYAASEMKQMRQSFDDLAAQLKQNNAALVQIDKRLSAVEDMKERLTTAEERIQRTREELLKHCARTGDTTKIGEPGGNRSAVNDDWRF